MTKAERTERNVRIGLMHARGASNAKIAETFGLTARQVRRIVTAWRESPLKLDTEGVAEAVVDALKDIRDDMDTLGVTAAAAPPEARTAILTERIDLITRNFKAMTAAGVSFEGVFDGKVTDPDLISEVNTAIRPVLEQHGVDRAVIDEALDAGLDVYTDWGFPVGPTPVK